LQQTGEFEEVRHEISTGEDGERALLQVLENRGFDLAINGIGCREGQAILLKPTLEQVTKSSRCPVLTLGSHLRESADGELKYIVYATDFSAESLEARRYALSLAQEFQARLTLLHVVERVEPTPSPHENRLRKRKCSGSLGWFPMRLACGVSWRLS